MRQCSQDSTPAGHRYLSIDSNNTSMARRASGSDAVEESKAGKTRGHASAPHMIRSYSLPVATQRDYEAQRKRALGPAILRAPFTPSGRRQGGASENSCLGGPNAMTSSVSSMGASTKHQQQEQRHIIPPKAAKAGRTSLPRSPLSIITINEATSREQGFEDTSASDVDLGSGSDETEVATPRATSPMDDYFPPSDKESHAYHLDFLDDLIHPDHLRSPPGMIR